MKNDYSRHFMTNRKDRQEFIEERLGTGNEVRSFYVENGHANGAEIHTVTDTGVIIIKNAITGKIITEIIGRPAQLKRLYSSIGEEVPKKLLKTAYKNNSLHYNLI